MNTLIQRSIKTVVSASVCKESSGSLAVDSGVVDPCTDHCEPLCSSVCCCCSLPDPQHLFSCTPFDVLCDRAVVPVTGWPRLGFVRPSHLCCVLFSVSLCLCSALFFSALSFCPLSMIWWALHCSVLMVSLLVCVRACLQLCAMHMSVCYLTTSLMRIL